jgi:ketosteroid isomerase-like protein
MSPSPRAGNAAVLLLHAAIACSAQTTRPASAVSPVVVEDTATVRRELLQWYDANNRAFRAKDVAAIMALRTDDFHTLSPDGARNDRAAMELRTQGLLNGIERWITLEVDLDSIAVSGDTAQATVRQHLVRMGLRPDGVRHVETWATQRETWRRTPGGWKLYRVDNVRDQRRLIDGQPG